MSPGEQPHFVPDSDIRVNGARLHTEIAHDIAGIELVQEPNTLDHLRISIAQAADPGVAISLGARTQDPLLVFVEGSAIELSLGYVDALARVFEGEVTGVVAIFPEDGASTLEVHCHSYMHRLRRSARTKTYLKQKDTALALQLGRQAGLRVQADDSKVTHDFVLQYNQTDLEFLLERASRIGFELIADGKTLQFRKAGGTGASGPKLTYGGGSSPLLSVTLREELLGQGDSVTVRSVDLKGKAIVGKAAAAVVTPDAARSAPTLSKRAFGATETFVVDRPLATKADADALAASILNGRARGFVTGSGRSIGLPSLRAGGVIELDGVGKKFNGKYYVAQSTHVVGDDGYYTSFRVRRNAVG